MEIVKPGTTCCLLKYDGVMCCLQCAYNRNLEVTDRMHREQEEQMVKMAPKAHFCITTTPWWFNQAPSGGGKKT